MSCSFIFTLQVCLHASFLVNLLDIAAKHIISCGAPYQPSNSIFSKSANRQTSVTSPPWTAASSLQPSSPEKMARLQHRKTTASWFLPSNVGPTKNSHFKVIKDMPPQSFTISFPALLLQCLPLSGYQPRELHPYFRELPQSSWAW